MRRTLSTMQKLAASAAVLATAGALTAGAFAGWQSTAAQHQDIGAAIVASDFTAQNGSKWNDVDVTNMLPGDSVVRYAELMNSGSIQQTFVLDVQGQTGELTAANDGAKVSIRTCPTVWVGGVCAGDAARTISDAYITDEGVVSESIVLNPQVATHLQIGFSLPVGASADFQGLCDKFIVTETGTATDHGDVSVPQDVS